MKGRVAMVIVLVGLAVIAVAIIRQLGKARSYSGPGIRGNLRIIQHAKEMWLAEGGTNEWPTSEDLAGYGLPPGTVEGGSTVSERMRRTYHGEVYFINHTGATPFAYIPKESGKYRGGEIIVLRSNGVDVIRQ